MAALQQASDLLEECAPLHKALHEAIKHGKVHPTPGQSAIDAAVEAGVLQAAEGQRLREAEAARRRVIDVDAFDKEALRPMQDAVR